LSDVLELLDKPIPPTWIVKKINSIPFRKSISLENISFKYIPDGPAVLSNINLKIPKGSRVGFVGNTGSGKSTITDIIMALLLPSTGYLRVDDIEINQENKRSWQEHIAHVPQFIYLTDNSIAENIAFGVGCDEVDMPRVMRAARQAQIAEYIESLPEKYQTLVGERGVRLSGGQRQRIGIARALYKEAGIIIFDEATSALDNETEDSVMNAIEDINADVTLIMVAHRVTTLRNCHMIIALEGGEIKARGTYEQVIGNPD
jgi:ABC-type bacteriocin/lantibiotic exporter with double-glycine peptidase domain